MDKDAVAGWAEEHPSGERMLIVDANWPFSPPEIYLAKNHPRFGDAHVENSGKLCLAPAHSTYSQLSPVRLVEAVLSDANAFLDASSVRAEFVDEFQSYWLRDMSPKRKCLSLLNPSGPSRMVVGWHGKQFSVYGENEDDLRKWLRQLGESRKPPIFTVEPFVWFQRGLVPNEFPKTAQQLLELAEKYAADAVPLLSECVSRPVCQSLLGFETSNGTAMAGLILRRPSGFTNGFRENAMCKSVAVSRFFGREKLEGCRVERIDHAWLHSRGGEISHIALKDKRIIVVGCGSLGSGVAVLLAKSGVGHIILVDDDPLQWENIARHSLGAAAEGQNKAMALARELNRQVPSVAVEGVNATWQDAIATGRVKMEDADLVISTTGEWTADGMLNFECRSNLNAPAVLFGWLEEHALAGHALYVADIGGCLGCGMDEFGVFKERLTEWAAASTMIRAPACGGHYQPYGIGHLTMTQSLVATAAIDALAGTLLRSELRSWVAAKALVESLGGRWIGAGIPEIGGFRLRPWSRLPTCELC